MHTFAFVFREKDTHANHLRQLEEEMEAQMQRVENRVKSEVCFHLIPLVFPP